MGGSLDVADGTVVRAISSDGQETTVAGVGSYGFSGDGGPATSAELSNAAGVALDGNGDLLIADSDNHRIRLVAAASCASGCPYGLSSMTKGDIYTVAGNASQGSSGDGGSATSAELNGPGGVALDGNGDLLIADSNNHRVRLVAAATCASGCPYGLSSMTKGDIYTVAGNGSQGSSGDGGPATIAELDFSYNNIDAASGVAVDSDGDLLIPDTNNNRVRLVAAATCASGCPYGLSSMTKGDIYTVAGNGTWGYSGDAGPATSAELDSPVGVALDGSGDLLITDTYNDLVRFVAAASCASNCPYGLSSMTTGDIYTVAGGGTSGLGDGGPATSAELNSPQGVAIDSDGDLLVAETNGARVRLVAAASCASGCPYGLSSMTKGDIYTVAGNGTWGYSGDGGPAANAELQGPDEVAMDGSGDSLIADTYNDLVRLVAAASCASNCPYGLSSMTKGDIYTVAGNGSQGSSGDGGPATSAELYYPGGVGLDGSGDLLIADTYNGRVRLVAAASCASGCPYGLSSMTKGDIYTVAGGGTSGLGDGGPATGAELGAPGGVAVDSSGDLLVADTGDERVRLVAAASCSSGCPYGLSSMTKGDIYTVAGNGSQGSSGDGGPATSAELDFSYNNVGGPSGVAGDSDGDLLIADAANNRVRLVAAASCSSGCPYGLASMTKGDIYTVAGGGTSGLGDGGPATSASLNSPQAVALDGSGDLLIADTNNDLVRLVAAATCSSGCPYGLTSMTKDDIYTVAGGGTSGLGDGSPATSAELNSPEGVAVDSSGDLLIADTSNDRVRLVTGGPSGPTTYMLQVSVAGSGSGSVSGGGITCPGTCSVSVSQGSQVTLNTAPASGSSLAGWSGGGCSGTGACTVTMNSGELVTATFSRLLLSAAQIKVVLAGEIAPSGKLATIQAILKSGGFAFAAFKVPEAGSAVLSWYQAHGSKLTLIATGKLTLSKAGTGKLTVKLTAAGHKLLKKANSLKLKLTGQSTFTPSGQPAVSPSATFTLRK
ncbi:MAG: InlB B-repeat-containing protein [Solirubrobacteraceae bacterium]